MSDGGGKRPRDADDEYQRPAKRDSYRVEEFLESMDPSVRIKLRSMFDDGLLMTSDLDERNITELSKFDAAVALEILEHYCAGDLSQVRNRRAYLAGAIKRRSHLVRLPGGDELVLAPEVQHRLNQIKQMSAKAGELDQRSLDALASLPPSRALMTLDRYGSKDFTEVRNPSALFMSMLRQVMDSGGSGDWGSGGGGYRGGTPRGPPTPRGDYGDYGPPAPPPPPPPPRRPAQAGPASGSFAAAAGSLPPGTTLTQGPNGSLVLSAAPVIPGISAGVQGLGGGAAAAPGLVLAAGQGPGGVAQYMLVSSSSAQGAPAGAQVIAAPGGGGLPGQQPLLGVPQQAAAPAAVPAGVPADWAAGRKHYGTEQGQLGVRVGEFHELSPYASFVHPSPALKLQQLWDNGNELVSMLDDKVWQVLAEMPAPEALAAIQEAADALDNPDAQIRNINAFFMSVVKKVWPQHGLPPRAAAGGAPGRPDFYSASRSRDGPHHGGYHGGRGGGRGGYQGGDWGEGGGYEGGGGGGAKPQWSRQPAIHLLPAGQRELAESLCRAHAPLLREEHFDEGVIDSLARLSHEDGVAVLHELGNNSMAGVRNLPAYIMGICKRYGTGQRSAGHR